MKIAKTVVCCGIMVPVCMFTAVGFICSCAMAQEANEFAAGHDITKERALDIVTTYVKKQYDAFWKK